MNSRIIAKTIGGLAVLMGLTMAVCWLFAWWKVQGGEATDLNLSATRALGISTGVFSRGWGASLPGWGGLRSRVAATGGHGDCRSELDGGEFVGGASLYFL